MTDDREQNKVTLRINGTDYWGWKSASTLNALECITNSFNVSVSDRWPGMEDAWTITKGDACEVLIGTDLVLTGYIEKVHVKFDSKSHTITVTGRGKTCDLVDCSAAPQEWVEVDMNGITAEIIAPFGLGLVEEVKTDILNKYAINVGDTCHCAIEKMANMQGVLVITNELGDLVITRAGLSGEADDMLVLGGNLLEAELDDDATHLFSEIKVKGQANTSTVAKTQDPYETTVLSRTGIANDGSGHPPIDRFRPLIIVTEEQALEADCAFRAGWEASTRTAKGKKLVCKVQGWRQTTGVLWKLNTLVRVDCPWSRTEEQWLISSVNHKIGDKEGSTTEMILFKPEAFQVLPSIPAAKAPKKQPQLSGVAAKQLSGVGKK